MVARGGELQFEPELLSEQAVIASWEAVVALLAVFDLGVERLGGLLVLEEELPVFISLGVAVLPE